MRRVSASCRRRSSKSDGGRSGRTLLPLAALASSALVLGCGALGAILFLAGGFTAVSGRDAAQKNGLGWSLLRIGFGLLSLLILVVGAALLLRATR
jgi:hypothetical protein